jgi:16S rRNA C967 or C1407 C5-methylase (RsmB/RsmF family)
MVLANESPNGHTNTTKGSRRTMVYAFDRSSTRFETLQKMVTTAGASSHVVCHLTNFLDVRHL